MHSDPNEYLLGSYEYYVQKWLDQDPILRKVVPTVDDAGNLQNEDEIRMFIIAFRTMVGLLATLKTFSKFDWADLAVVMDEDEYEGYKSWYMYYRDQQKLVDPKVSVPVDVDFDIELVRTDRINVVYILNLLKNTRTGTILTPEQIQANVDLVLRELERSDNESLRAKKGIMREFIETVFYDLDENADIQKAYEDFEARKLDEEIVTYSIEADLQPSVVRELFSDYSFSGSISEEKIRTRLSYYNFGLLKMTKMTGEVKDFIINTYNKFKAEEE